MASNEIITIQAGFYSNFIGTHWWNLQESSFCYDPNSVIPRDINHDVLFREGVNYKREVTYTPRLIVIDLKDNMKSIRRESPLYRLPDVENDLLWEGPMNVIKESPVKKNPFLEETSVTSNLPCNSGEPHSTDLSEKFNFNEPETVWCDFLKTNLHPRSFCLLQEISPDSGEEVYLKNGKDMFEDTVRKMSEECDYLQGFNIIFDACNGFSGICNHVLLHLDDEYNRRPSLCFPTFQSKTPGSVEDSKEQMHRLYAILSSLNCLTNHSSLFSPLSLFTDVVRQIEPLQTFPFLNYDVNLHYQTSSIFAAAIDTLTSQFRLKSMKFSLSDVTSAMSMYSRKLVCSSLCLPFPLSYNAFLNTMIQSKVPEYYMTSLTPYYIPQSGRTLHQSAVLRGIPKSKFMNPSKSVYSSYEPEEIFGEYLNKYSSSSITTATVLYEKCCVGYPFPNIFKKSVGVDGYLTLDDVPNNMGVDRVPAAASFSSSDSAGQFLETLLTEASRFPFKEYVKCAESSFEKDDFTEVIQTLIGLQDNYQDY